MKTIVVIAVAIALLQVFAGSFLVHKTQTLAASHAAALEAVAEK